VKRFAQSRQRVSVRKEYRRKFLSAKQASGNAYLEKFHLLYGEESKEDQMLNEETITRRLEDMVRQNDPSDLLWPENCAGSRKALVIFVGPSPGGKKEDNVVR